MMLDDDYLLQLYLGSKYKRLLIIFRSGEFINSIRMNFFKKNQI